MNKCLIAKVLNGIGILLMVTVIAAMLPLAVPKLLGYQLYGVLTGSMTPTYSVGSIVFVERCTADEIMQGDVITFHMGSETDYVMTHRVLELDEEKGTFLTKGDANDTADSEPVSFDRLVGKVVYTVPGLAALADFVNSITGKAVLFCFFAISLLFFILADILAPDRKEKRNRKKNRGRPVVLVIGVLCICGALFYLGRIFYFYGEADSEYDLLAKQVFQEKENQQDGTQTAITEADRKVLDALAKLQKTNPEAIGWITLETLGIDYPVMQGEDNVYYLNHTFSGKKNASGSIFMEAANEPDFNDCHTILYGHNMKDLSMFGALKNYKTEDFYNGNEEFMVYTTQQVYRYRIFSYYDISEYGDIYDISFAPDEEFQEFLNKMIRHSYYDTNVNAVSTDKILTLSTCSAKGKRFVVHALRVLEK